MSTVAALNREGAPLALDQKHVDALRGALRGPLLLAGDAGYDDARSVWNAMIDRRPAAIARCLGVADVIAGVQLRARARACPVHQGRRPQHRRTRRCDGGLMLDLSLMRGVWVDPQAGGARAGRLPARRRRPRDPAPWARRGARLRLQHRDRGLTLGGGFGYLTRRFGWTTRQRALDGRGHRRRPAGARERGRRTPISSGVCAAAAATSAS